MDRLLSALLQGYARRMHLETVHAQSKWMKVQSSDDRIPVPRLFFLSQVARQKDSVASFQGPESFH
jgi:hypothetical protein